MAYIKISDLPEKERVKGYFSRVIHTEHMTMAYWTIKAGSPMPEHSHPSEQVTTLIEGSFEMVVGGERRVLDPGIAAVIPSGVPHSGISITDCKIIDVFSPPREDLKS